MLESSAVDSLDRAWLVASCPAPSGAARHLMDAKLTGHSVYFASGDGSSDEVDDQSRGMTFVGVGAAVAMRLEGARRFSEAKSRMVRAFSQLSAPSELLPYLRFFGGASFSPGRDGKGPCWSDFGDGSFVLPQVIYVDRGTSAILLFVATKEEPRPALELAGQVLSAAQSASETRATAALPLRTLSRKESEEAGSWQRLVDDIRASIQSGQFEKVVAARRVTLELSGEPQLSAIIDRFNADAPRCARFALRIGERTFVGATPERLVRKEGSRVGTEALAGSIDSRAPEAAAKLQASTKDQHEHAYVVEAIRAALTPLCDALQIPKDPEVRVLRHLLHLRTPIRGHLREDVHVLDLVERLHPTPAVGGLPREEAVRFIDTHEQAERGWYAAPMGWVDACGNGEFVVALRSGLICRDKVHLYAGAGIVAESNAAAEFEETELKLSGMLGALGITP